MVKNNPKKQSWEEETRAIPISFSPDEEITKPLYPHNKSIYDPGEDPTEAIQPIYISNTRAPVRKAMPQEKQRRPGCCFWILFIPIIGLLAVYLLFPTRTNILILGLDRAPEGSNVSRTDTNIILSIIPFQPVVNMLSIPRDLWVAIPGFGENRINTAHFFAEGNQAGSGPYAAMDTIRQNFGLTIDYYARIRFDGFTKIIDAMGGITFNLDEPMSGYPAGQIHLDGTQALAFARDRSGSDDFFRMQRGHMVIKAVLKNMINPLTWPRLPLILTSGLQAIDTNIPLWQMPRIGLALVRAVISNTINNQTISREMVNPYTTDQGANVLIPNWQAINPLLLELFGE
jgi:LCP family protein required for cell wall assembly